MKHEKIIIDSERHIKIVVQLSLKEFMHEWRVFVYNYSQTLDEYDEVPAKDFPKYCNEDEMMSAKMKLWRKLNPSKS